MDTPNPGTINTNVSMEPILYTAEPLTQSRVDEFIHATRSTFASGTFPLTFGTLFRRAEFLWLERMKVDLRNLLHTDQEYEYVSAFQVGDVPAVSTKILNWKERRGMIFVTLETDVCVLGARRVLATTTFVVRPTKANENAK